MVCDLVRLGAFSTLNGLVWPCTRSQIKCQKSDEKVCVQPMPLSLANPFKHVVSRSSRLSDRYVAHSVSFKYILILTCPSSSHEYLENANVCASSVSVSW